jgi:hypothetical protein
MKLSLWCTVLVPAGAALIYDSALAFESIHDGSNGIAGKQPLERAAGRDATGIEFAFAGVQRMRLHASASYRRIAMTTAETFRLANSTVARATASLETSTAAARSVAMENAWATPLPRTYFVGGFRVQHQRDAQGHSTWTCDCSEFAGSDCQHTRRVAAAAELDQLLRTPGLVIPTNCY